MRVSSNHIIYIPCNGAGTVVRISADFLDYLGHLAREAPSGFPPLSVERFLHDVAMDTLQQGQSRTQTRQSPLETFRWLQHLEAGGNPRLEPQLRKQTAALDKLIISLNSSLCGITLSVESFEHGSTTIVGDELWHRWLVALGLAMRDPLALCSSGASPMIVNRHGYAPWWQCPQYGDCSISVHSILSPGIRSDNFFFDAEDFDSTIVLPVSIAPAWRIRETSLRHIMLGFATLRAVRETTWPEGTVGTLLHGLSWHKILVGHRPTIAMQVLGCVLECGVAWLRSLLPVTYGGVVLFLTPYIFQAGSRRVEKSR